MSRFFMFGKYVSDTAREMSSERTGKAVELLKKYGGNINSMYALLGEHDLALIVDFPGIEEAIKGSIALSKLTGILFTTSPAVTVDKFDKMMTEL
ncbi:MAG: GYD domain-containing protein [Chitinispirillaceae bacterium]|nr:GYD domain-containing protein [Chitinispirillaceae bacterium]